MGPYRCTRSLVSIRNVWQLSPYQSLFQVVPTQSTPRLLQLVRWEPSFLLITVPSSPSLCGGFFVAQKIRSKCLNLINSGSTCPAFGGGNSRVVNCRSVGTKCCRDPMHSTK